MIIERAMLETCGSAGKGCTFPHLVALVRAGATFINGKLVERADDVAA